DDLGQSGVVAATFTALPAPAEARATGFEDQPSHPFGGAEAEAQRHPRSKRVAGDVHPLDLPRVEQAHQRLKCAVEGGVRVDRALAVAREVRGEHLEPRPEQRTQVVPRLATSGEPVEQEEGWTLSPDGVGEQAHGPPSSSARATAAPSDW